MEAACRRVDTSCSTRRRGSGGHARRREAAAKQVCGTCRVVELCAAYTVATREPYGTWGGLSEGVTAASWCAGSTREWPSCYRSALPTWERESIRGLTRVAAPGQAEGWPPAGPGRIRPGADAGPDAGHPGGQLLALVPGLDPTGPMAAARTSASSPSGTPLTSWNRSPSGVWRTRMSPGRLCRPESVDRRPKADSEPFTVGCSRACRGGRTSPLGHAHLQGLDQPRPGYLGLDPRPM